MVWWQWGASQLDIHKNFVGPDAAINSSDVKQFCAVAGNQGEAFKVARNVNVQAPMDFAIVTCWKVISIFSLHTLSLIFFRPSWNLSFQLLLTAIYSNSSIYQTVSGDIWHPEARIVTVTNSSEGKIVKVKGRCYRNNQPFIEVVSSFLYWGRFIDYENTFDTTEEPDYLVL